VQIAFSATATPVMILDQSWMTGTAQRCDKSGKQPENKKATPESGLNA